MKDSWPPDQHFNTGLSEYKVVNHSTAAFGWTRFGNFNRRRAIRCSGSSTFKVQTSQGLQKPLKLVRKDLPWVKRFSKKLKKLLVNVILKGTS
jgi:hypothetical protein